MSASSKKVFKVKTLITAAREDLVLAESEQEARDWVLSLHRSGELEEFLAAGDYEPDVKSSLWVGAACEVENLCDISAEWSEAVLWGENPDGETAKTILAGAPKQ